MLLSSKALPVTQHQRASELQVSLFEGVLDDLQVPRILNPVVLVVDSLPDLCKDAQVNGYVESMFGSVEQCR